MTRLFPLGLGYIFGNLLFAMIVGRLFLHCDPSQYGSHNPGTANIGAVFGKSFGILTCCGDLMKTLVCLFLVHAWYPGHLALAYAGLGLILGHCFPIWNGFKGGKGVAVSAPVILFFDWRAGVLFLLLGLVLTIGLKNLTLPPLLFMLGDSFFVLITHGLESGSLFLLMTAVMGFKFKDDLIAWVQGKAKRVDILTSLKKQLRH